MTNEYMVREYITKNVRHWFIVKSDSRRKVLGPFFEKEKAEERLKEDYETNSGGVYE